MRILAGLFTRAPDGVSAVNRAVVAIERGDHAAALKLLRPLATDGYALAQYNLGVAYGTGQGSSRTMPRR
jgi:TPR repeat protein